jgi:hypothetical protein
VDWELAWSLQQMLGVCRHGVFPSKPSRFGDGGLCLWAPVRQSGQWWWAGRRVWQRQMASAEFFGWRWRGLEEWSVQAPLGVVDLHAWLGLRCSALLCAAACSPETTLLWRWPACCCSGARVSTSFPCIPKISSSETGRPLRAADVGCVLEQTGCG